MFTPKTERIKIIADEHPRLITKLDFLLSGRTIMYIDYANIRPWSNKLRFHIDIKRLKQFLDSFSQIGKVHFYQGTLVGDEQSESDIQDLMDRGYVLHTKPVKIMELSIDVTSLQSMHAPDLLSDFIRTPLLKTLTSNQIETLNHHLQNLNQQGIRKLQDRKCNFDVEIGVDMLLDLERDSADTFVLWSGDSDFADPIQQLLDAKKKVILFATAGRISRELNGLRSAGLVIFDIRDLEKFVCWLREFKKLNL
jgi:uncharacterized LabA/DUF88 family protein